jgi:hypothetical protein
VSILPDPDLFVVQYMRREAVLSSQIEATHASLMDVLQYEAELQDSQTKPPFNREPIVPSGYDWPSLLTRDGDELEIHYRHALEELGRFKGMLGVIFRKAQNKVQDPAKLRRLHHRPDRP